MRGQVSPVYLVSAFVLPLLIPAGLAAYEGSAVAFAKWAAFWAVGVRLGLAGARQAVNPRFTAQTIFGVADPDALPIVREVGLANLSFAVLGVCSLYVPAWRPAALLTGGAYFGLAGALHAIRKPATATESVALVSDVLVFLALAAAFAIILAK